MLAARGVSIDDVDVPYSVLTRVGDGLLGVGLNRDGLVALSIDEVVMHDLDTGVFGGQQGDLVGNGLSISKGRNILGDVGETHDDLVGIGSGQLTLGLLTENDDIGVGMALEKPASGLAQTRVDTTAKTLVGACNDEQSLLVFEGLGFGVLEDLVGGLTVDSGLLHSSLGTGETGRGDDLHGVGDLLDVLDGLKTTLNLTESGKVGRIGRGSPIEISIPIFFLPLTPFGGGNVCFGRAARYGGWAAAQRLTE